MRYALYGLCLCAILSQVGCSEPASDRKPTIPVTGVVYVDGQPAEGLAVTLHEVTGRDTQNPTISSGVTDASGAFKISTYEAGDGAPAGEYNATFSWGQMNLVSMQFEGDKLKGKYASPEKSKSRLKVEEGKPVDMGKIELSTK